MQLAGKSITGHIRALVIPSLVGAVVVAIIAGIKVLRILSEDISAIGFMGGTIGYAIYIIAWLAALALAIALEGWIGWKTTRQPDGNPKQALAAGVLFGILTGILLTFYLLVIALVKLLLRGAEAGLTTGLKALLVLVFGTIVCALVGGVTAFIAGTLAKGKNK